MTITDTALIAVLDVLAAVRHGELNLPERAIDDLQCALQSLSMIGTRND